MHIAARGREPTGYRCTDTGRLNHTNVGIRLRALAEEDGPEFLDMLRHPAISSRLCRVPYPLSEAAGARLLDELVFGFGGAPAATVVEAEGRFACCIAFAQHADSGGYELMCWTAADLWGRGIATAALLPILRAVIETTDVPGIFARTTGDNPAALRVLQKLGFEPVGRGEPGSCARSAASVPHFWLDRQRPQLVLETRRLLLTRPYAADIPRYVSLLSDIEVAKQTARIPHPYTRADAEAFVAGRVIPDDLVFAIRLKDEDGALIGGAGFGVPGEGMPEIGYWIGRSHWGQGYATEAARAVIDLVFSSEQVTEIHASARVTNSSSRRVLEKCGFQHSGTGLIRSVAVGGAVPVDRFRLDRSTWRSILAWRPAIRRERRAEPDTMGAER